MTITSPDDAYLAFKQIFDPATIEHREYMYAIFLNKANKLLGYAQISAGGVSGTLCDPKIVFQHALKMNASAIVLAHNHPSGTLKPSKADEALTEKIAQAGIMLDITLLDHLIISVTGFKSIT